MEFGFGVSGPRRPEGYGRLLATGKPVSEAEALEAFMA
jgi:hypothetical protein